MNVLVLEHDDIETYGTGPICIIYYESNPKLINRLVRKYAKEYKKLAICKQKDEYIAQRLREDNIEFIMSYEYDFMHV